MKIGIDLDGVLADFNTGYIDVIQKLTGRVLPRPSASYPDTWYYERAAGVTKDEENQIWEHIKTTEFWGKLEVLPGTLDAIKRLNVLRYGHGVYFITSRPGSQAKFWSEMWLSFHGYQYPTVIIADDKGSIAKGLQLDVFVDDKPENIEDVVAAHHKVRAYIINQPYNGGFDELAFDQVLRVGSLNEVLDIEFPKTRLIKEAA